MVAASAQSANSRLPPISPALCSVDNELLTPTFKLKRPQLFKHYEPEVTSM